MSRQRIFSTTPRKKLFSEEKNGEDGIRVRTLICPDCGTQVETAEHPSGARCPNCGGTRMRIKFIPYSEPGTPEPVRVEEREYSIFLNDYEKKLKEFSGKSMTPGEFEKTFGEKSDYLLEKGFANVCGDRVDISKTAFPSERLFSKLIVQVTKVMDLEPNIVSGMCPKEDLISRLEDSGRIPERGIILLKKAHGIIPMRNMEEEGKLSDDWMEDSKINSDLRLEYGGESFGLKQFMDLLRNRYPDAPENIIDSLVSRGTISLSGSQIVINK
jgi:ribosomal protein S27AE